MPEIRKIRRLVYISFARYITNRKTILIAGMAVIFAFYNYMPLTRLAMFYHENIPPVSFVFHLSHYLVLCFHAAASVLLFADVMKEDGFTLWTVIRSGKTEYILAQSLYVLLMSAVYVLFLYLLSLAFTLPVLGSIKEWGPFMKRMSQDMTSLVQESGISGHSLYVTPVIIRHFTPAGALLFAFLIMWLDVSFTGMMILFFSCVISRSFATAFGGVLVSIAIFATVSGMLLFGTRLLYASPMSWNNINNIDYDRSGAYPSPEYVVTFLTAGIIMFAAGSYIGYRHKEAIKG